jgi:ecotin
MIIPTCLLAILAWPGDDPRPDDTLKAFPQADPGIRRHVLHLPPAADESALRVELIVGKTELLDPVNRYKLGGQITEETIPGWGYPCYVVKQVGPLAGTLIGVDPDTPRAERFIRLGGEPYLIRYNSKLPVVIYTPSEAEVRYRLWRADPEEHSIDEG